MFYFEQGFLYSTLTVTTEKQTLVVPELLVNFEPSDFSVQGFPYLFLVFYLFLLPLSRAWYKLAIFTKFHLLVYSFTFFKGPITKQRERNRK